MDVCSTIAGNYRPYLILITIDYLYIKIESILYYLLNIFIYNI